MDAATGLLMAVKQVELPTGSAPNEERKKSMLSALERELAAKNEGDDLYVDKWADDEDDDEADEADAFGYSAEAPRTA